MLEELSLPTLLRKTYRTISHIKGPLLFIERTSEIAYDELVEITPPDGDTRLGRVLEVDGSVALVQVFTGTAGLDLERTAVRFTGDVARLDVAPDLLGRAFDGLGRPLDGGPPVTPEASLDMNGSPLNPAVRLPPSEYIETGISAIDGLNTLTRGQKLPIFSGSGLPADRLAAQIAAQVEVAGAAGEDFSVVFAAMGVTHREVDYFLDRFRQSGAINRAVLFLNRADDPSVLRLLTPRAALTAAEYLAYDQGRHVLVIMTDMTNYCEALREVAAAREEIPGRRGYPGYMYSDLASLYERAGRIKDNPGSVTQLVILTMPDDDITHPIPDLTGYITEGQVVLSRDLHQQGIYPPVDVLPSLSRQMDAGIGRGQTRADHRGVANQLYALYARGDDLRRLVAIIGEDALSQDERRVLAFAGRFETAFVHQGSQQRNIETTLDLAWELLSDLPARQLGRLSEELIDQYHRPEGADGGGA